MLSALRHNPYFRRIAQIAVLAVMLPIWLPLLHHPVPASSVSPTMRHCSMGMSQSTHVPGKASTTPRPSCPLCQSMHLLGSGLVPAISGAVVGVLSGKDEFRIADHDHNVSQPVSPGARPRAPPYFA